MELNAIRNRQTTAYTAADKTGKAADKAGKTADKTTAAAAESAGAAETAGARAAAAPETAKAVSKNGEAATFESTGTRYQMDVETVQRLRDESEQRMADLVKKMLGQQIGDGVNIWEKLRTGDFTVDEETIEQAKADTAEDGYWGVEQTSDRFIQYATALTGGDPDKLDSMIEAFEKGYAEAEKAWGGKLPELSQRTRETTLQKFKDLKEQYAKNSAPTDAAAQGLVENNVQKTMAAAAARD